MNSSERQNQLASRPKLGIVSLSSAQKSNRQLSRCNKVRDGGVTSALSYTSLLLVSIYDIAVQNIVMDATVLSAASIGIARRSSVSSAFLIVSVWL